MPVTTFLDNLQRITYQAVSDKELNDLFQEVRKIDNRYLLRELIEVKKRLFRKPKIIMRYTLFYDYLAPNSNWDIQIINLNRNSKDVVMAYFYGFLGRKD